MEFGRVKLRGLTLVRVWVWQACHGKDGAALVSTGAAEALKRGDVESLARRAFDLFLGIYGAHVGNSGLKYLATGGIYLAGGILPKNLAYIEAPEGKRVFMTSFFDKGRMKGLLERMPLRVVKNDDIAIQGSQVIAKRVLRQMLLATAIQAVPNSVQGGLIRNQQSTRGGWSRNRTCTPASKL